MKRWFKYSEHFEKYWFLLFSTLLVLEQMYITYLAFYKDESMFQTSYFYLCTTTWLIISGLLIRKGFKMWVGKDGIKVCQDAKEDITEVV